MKFPGNARQPGGIKLSRRIRRCYLLITLWLASAHCIAAGSVDQMWSSDTRRHVVHELPELWRISDEYGGLYVFGQLTTVGQVASKTDNGSRYQGSINWEQPGAVRLFRGGRHGGGMLAWNALGTFVSSSSQDNFLHQRMGADSETYDDLVEGEFMIRELWYSHAVAQDLYLMGGKLDPSNIWDMNALANEATEDFLAGSLNDSQAILFPDSGAGATVHSVLSDSLRLSAGLQQNNAKETSFNINEFDIQQVFYGAELHWSVGANHARPGNYRLLAYYSRKNSKRDEGLSLSADQQFGKFGLFTRITLANNDINPVSRFFSAGLSLYPQTTRPDNKLGVGFSWSKVDDGRNETVAELFYRLELNRFLALTPDLQLVSNPAYARGSSNIWVANLRLQASF